MFISQSKYLDVLRKLNTANRHLSIAREQWNHLIKLINEKGGQRFLDEAVINTPTQFTPEEIETLISLCHPDRHAGSSRSTTITQKLLTLRKKKT